MLCEWNTDVLKATLLSLKERTMHRVIHMPHKGPAVPTPGNQTQITVSLSSVTYLSELFISEKQTNKQTKCKTRILPLKCPKMFHIQVNREQLK